MAAKKRTAKKAPAGKKGAARKKAPARGKQRKASADDKRDEKPEFSAAQKRALKALEPASFHVTNACKAAGVGRNTYYRWLKEDEAFATAVLEMREGRIDELEDKLIDRAINGWLEPHWVEGEEKLRIKFDNTLSWKVLQSLRAKHYRNRKPDDALSLPVELPAVTDAKTCMQAAAAVLAEASTGKIPMDQAKALMEMVDKTRAAIETKDLAERLEAIEDQLRESDDDD